MLVRLGNIYNFLTDIKLFDTARSTLEYLTLRILSSLILEVIFLCYVIRYIVHNECNKAARTFIFILIDFL